MNIARRLPPLRRILLFSIASFLAAAFAFQLASAQSGQQAGHAVLAEVNRAPDRAIKTKPGVRTGRFAAHGVMNRLSLLFSPLGVTVGGVDSSNETGLMPVGSTSLRTALLSESSNAEKTRVRGEILVNQRGLTLRRPGPTRTSVFGLGAGGTLKMGTEFEGRRLSPRIGLSLDGASTRKVDPGTEGVVLLSVEF